MECSQSHSSRLVAPADRDVKSREVLRHGTRRGSHRGSAFLRERKASWRRTGILIKRILELSSISNAAAIFCALLYGHANPFRASFAGDATARARAAQGMATLMAFYLPFFGMIASCALFAFFIRGRFLRSQIGAAPYRPLSLSQSWWITVKLTWKLAFVLVVASVGVTQGLFAVNVPVLRYNFHSLIGLFCVAIHAVRTISRTARFRQNSTGSLTSTSHTRVWSVSLPRPSLQPMASLRRYLRVGLANVFPPLLAAGTGMQYVSAGKHLNVEDPCQLVAFALGSLLLKFFLQVVAKLVAAKAKTAGNNTRNRLYMILSPILIIDIYLRMAMLRVVNAGGTVSLFINSVFLGVLEILVRFITVLVDRLMIKVARRQLEKRKRQLLRRPEPASLLNVLPSNAVLPLSTTTEGSEKVVAALDADFMAWKANHLHLCAVEVMAEMVAEYCSIGFACIYMVALHNTPAFDLGISDRRDVRTTSEWLQFVGTQISTYVVQVAIEICSDIVGCSFEFYMGIPVDDAFDKDEIVYMRWTVLVVAIHAGGLLISSMVSTGSVDQ